VQRTRLPASAWLLQRSWMHHERPLTRLMLPGAHSCAQNTQWWATTGCGGVHLTRASRRCAV